MFYFQTYCKKKQTHVFTFLKYFYLLIYSNTHIFDNMLDTTHMLIKI